MKIFIFLFLLTITPVQNNSNNAGKDSIKNLQIIVEDNKAQKNQFSEATVYEKLYESEKENNEKLLSAVYWTLGTSITFLIAIFGGQIFFNWRVNKKEIDYIKKDIEEKIGQLKADLLLGINQNNKDNSSTIRSAFEKLEKESKSRIEELFEEKSKIFDIKEELIDLKIDSFKKDYETNLKRLKIDVEKNQGDLWILKGVERNALSRYVECAILNIEVGYEAKYILDDIIGLLNKIDEIHIMDENDLNRLIGLLTDKYSNQKDKIKELYINKPVYHFGEQKDFRGIYPKIYIKNFEAK